MTTDRRLRAAACRNCEQPVDIYNSDCCHVLGCRQCLRVNPRKCSRNARGDSWSTATQGEHADHAARGDAS